MTTLEIVFALVWAVYWTFADIFSTKIRASHGRQRGLLCWGLSVALTILVVAVANIKIAVVGMVVSTILSYIAYRKRMRDMNKSYGAPPEHCSDN